MKKKQIFFYVTVALESLTFLAIVRGSVGILKNDSEPRLSNMWPRIFTLSLPACAGTDILTITRWAIVQKRA